MPGIVAKDDAARKRKRTGDASAKSSGVKPRKAPKTSSAEDTQAKVLELEAQILESPDYYGNIVTLQKYTSEVESHSETATLAAVSLCRVFCRLIASEELVRRKDASDKDAQVVQMLRQRLREYVKGMSAWIGSPDGAMESTALTLLMRVAKEEVSQEPKRAEQAWRTSQSVFTLVLKALLEDVNADGAREEFVEKYVEEHDDVRFYTFLGIKQYFDEPSNREEYRLSNALDLLSKIEGVPESQDQLEDWYGEAPESKKHPLLSHLIKSNNWTQVLVFTRTKHGANKLVEQLGKDSIGAMAIHGNKSQSARTKALAEFKDGSLQVLVATDIAARGIDIDQLPHVVNYDLPRSAVDHVHRIGRTGRAGERGLAVSFVDASTEAHFRLIEKRQGQTVPRERIAGFEPAEVPADRADAVGVPVECDAEIEIVLGDQLLEVGEVLFDRRIGMVVGEGAIDVGEDGVMLARQARDDLFEDLSARTVSCIPADAEIAGFNVLEQAVDIGIDHVGLLDIAFALAPFCRG